MNRLPDEKQSLVPVVVMICFTLLLVVAMIVRVYRADRDLGLLRISGRQARLAAESGVHYAIEKMRAAVSSSDRAANPAALTAMFFADQLETEGWISFGQKTDAWFRIISVRQIQTDDVPGTRLLNESLQYQVLSEGRCGRFRYSTAAVVQLYDLVKSFAVFSSLDQHYYGMPMQAQVENAGSLEDFVSANAGLFNSAAINRQGICHDPLLLVKLFSIEGQDPFNAATGTTKVPENYGRRYFRDGTSPCVGPLYCES
ncbi:MAG: hypothetical protein PHD82_07720, partial [Candidatus Riflebacteria bacterium]|nr:hypothetical protein [Candidatus Riflebacteria bacterium]